MHKIFTQFSAVVLASLMITPLASAQEDSHLAPVLAPQEVASEALEDDPGPKNTLTISPLSLVFGTLSFEYERKLGSHASLFVGPELLMPFGVLRGLDEGESLYALEMRMGVRLFPFGNALEGFYVAFDVNAGWARGTADDLTATGTSGALGAAFGAQWQVDDVFAVGFDVGGGLRSAQVTVSDGREIGSAGPSFKIRLSVGVAF